MSKVVKMLQTVELIERVEPRSPVTMDIGYQPSLEREVVIKRLLPHLASDPRQRGRFIKDGRILAALNHPNIVHVYDAGVEDGVPYVVQEHLTGITVKQRLEQMIDQRIGMDIEEATWIVRDVADAIDHMHKQSVSIHALVPEHVVMTDDGRAVLIDLGLPLPANLLSATPTELAYAAPERLFGSPTGPYSDVYALGVMLYHLVIGRLPFEGSPAGIIAQKQNSFSLPVLDDPHADLPCPYALAHTIRQATARDVNQRYQSIAAFHAALVNALEGYPTKVELLPGATAQPLTAAADPIAPADQPRAFATQGRTQTRHALRSIASARVNRRQVAGEHDLAAEAAAAQPLERAFGEPQLEPAVAEPLVGQPVAAPVIDLATIDELMPGRENPALHAALPYTVLVPMPEEPTTPKKLGRPMPRAHAPAPQPAPVAAAEGDDQPPQGGHGGPVMKMESAAPAAQATTLTTLTTYFWIILLVVLATIAVSAAMMLG